MQRVLTLVRDCRVASFELEEFEAAKTAFEEAKRLDPKNKQAAAWLSKCDAALEGVQRPVHKRNSNLLCDCRCCPVMPFICHRRVHHGAQSLLYKKLTPECADVK